MLHFSLSFICFLSSKKILFYLLIINNLISYNLRAFFLLGALGDCIFSLTFNRHCLGLPSLIGKSKKQALKSIRKGVEELRRYKKVGKEVSIKAVALAIPTYTTNVFKLPTTLCNDLH